MLEATPPMSDRILAGQWLLRRLRLGSSGPGAEGTGLFGRYTKRRK
jgi:hypothetical protein